MRSHDPAGVVEDVVPFPGHISQRRQAICCGETRGVYRVAGKFDLMHHLNERAELGQLGWRESVEQHREAHVWVWSVVAEAIMQGFNYVTDIVGLEEVDQYPRRSNGASILLASVCGRLRQWAVTISPDTNVEVSGASTR